MVAMLLEKENKVPEALKAYQRILEIDPHAAIAANNLAWQYAELGGNLDVALQLAKTATSQAPDDPEFNDTLGWVYYKQDLVDTAVPIMSRVVEKNPKNPRFHFHLGMAYAKQGEDAKAIAEFKRALALDPKFQNADEAKRMIKELTP